MTRPWELAEYLAVILVIHSANVYVSGQCSTPLSYKGVSWFQFYTSTPYGNWIYGVYTDSALITNRNDNVTFMTQRYDCKSSFVSGQFYYYLYSNMVLGQYCGRSKLIESNTALFVTEIQATSVTQASDCVQLFTPQCFQVVGAAGACSAAWKPSVPLASSPVFTAVQCPFQGNYQLTVSYSQVECAENADSTASVQGSSFRLNACDGQAANTTFKERQILRETMTCLGNTDGSALNQAELDAGTNLLLLVSADNQTVYCARYRVDGGTIHMSIDVQVRLSANCRYSNTSSSKVGEFLALTLGSTVSTTQSAMSHASQATGVGVTGSQMPMVSGSAAGGTTKAGGGSTAVVNSAATNTAGRQSTAGGGQSTAAAGQSTAAAGQSTAVAGQSTAAAGQSTAVAGQSTAVAGQSTAAAGQSTAAAGQSTAAAGQSTAAQGQTTAGTSKITVAAAQSTAAGSHSTAAGGQSTAAAQQTTNAAKSTAAAGQSTAGRGQTTAAGGQTTAVGGQTTAAAMQSTAAAGQTTTAGKHSTAAAGLTTAAGAGQTTAANRGQSTADVGKTTARGGIQTTAANGGQTTLGGNVQTTAPAGEQTTKVNPCAAMTCPETFQCYVNPDGTGRCDCEPGMVVSGNATSGNSTCARAASNASKAGNIILGLAIAFLVCAALATLCCLCVNREGGFRIGQPRRVIVQRRTIQDEIPQYAAEYSPYNQNQRISTFYDNGTPTYTYNIQPPTFPSRYTAYRGGLGVSGGYGGVGRNMINMAEPGIGNKSYILAGNNIYRN